MKMRARDSEEKDIIAKYAGKTEYHNKSGTSDAKCAGSLKVRILVAQRCIPGGITSSGTF